jgi:hypothetical protein
VLVGITCCLLETSGRLSTEFLLVGQCLARTTTQQYSVQKMQRWALKTVNEPPLLFGGRTGKGLVEERSLAEIWTTLNSGASTTVDGEDEEKGV